MANQVSASHILLMYSGSIDSTAMRTQEEAITLINNLKVQIDEGADFATLAAENSDCLSGQQGGDLGTFGPGQMVPEFEEVVFSMDVDATSDVVMTDFGYHLIKRTA